MSKNYSDYDNLTSLFTGIRNKNVDIEKNIAPVESDASSSSKAYAVNSRLILGDKLYKVIAAIDIGDALIVGTNIELSSNLVTLIGQGGGGAAYYAGPGINISDDNVISSKAVEFAGTQAEWDALSAQEKSVFDYINITDDTSEETYQPGHSISDGTSEKTQREILEFNGFNVTDDSVNGKTKISEVPYTAGDGVEITGKEISTDDELLPYTFVGTKAEWETLSVAEKAKYKLVNLTDDIAGGDMVVVDTVAENDMNPVTSNAVYAALESALTWTYASTFLQDGSVDLTGIDYNEISVEVYDPDTNSRFQEVIPKRQIPSAPSYFYIGGYYALSSSTGSIRCIISTTVVKLDHYFINGTESSARCTLGVWYR